MDSYVIVRRAVTAKQGILGTPSQYGDGRLTFIFSNSFVRKNERAISNGTKFKIKVDVKENITEGHPGEVYHWICRCVERRRLPEL